MSEFTISGQTYRAGRLDPITQLHLMRKIAPVLVSLKGLAGEATHRSPAEIAANNGAASMLSTIEAIQPLVQAVASLDDATANYTISTCLSVVSRQQPGGAWAPVWSVQAERPMFQDIGPVDLLQLVGQVLAAHARELFGKAA